MLNISNIDWKDPKETIWGFHVHQELPLEHFPKALVIQNKCAEFLHENDIPMDASDCIKPGYGPHLDYMWELRVENLKEFILEKMGFAISYMAINRFGLSAYIHPLMHDPELPDDKALEQEGHHNQKNALWFTHRVAQKQDFFFNPPKDECQNIIDTRTPRVMEKKEILALYEKGLRQMRSHQFQDPRNTIIHGFHIHMDFSIEDEALGLEIFKHFNRYLYEINRIPTSTRLYKEKENGPHLQRGWEVKFETRDPNILQDIGIAIAWLMCNRQGLSVFFHPVTWEEGDPLEELNAHKHYAFFLGDLPALDLSFFEKKSEVESI